MRDFDYEARSLNGMSFSLKSLLLSVSNLCVTRMSLTCSKKSHIKVFVRWPIVESVQSNWIRTRFVIAGFPVRLIFLFFSTSIVCLAYAFHWGYVPTGCQRFKDQWPLGLGSIACPKNFEQPVYVRYGIIVTAFEWMIDRCKVNMLYTFRLFRSKNWKGCYICKRLMCT